VYEKFLKRFCDFVLSLVFLILLAPLILLIACILKLIQGEVFFTQARPGLNEKIFKIYKFKTMNDARNSKGELLDDSLRLKGFGKFLRALSLDELPQLFNVLKGDMSFVGPRPLLVEYLKLYDQTQRLRHKVRPGITGLAQVNGRNAITWQEKFKYDVYYVHNLSFILDLKIFYLTFIKVLSSSGVNKKGYATTEKFNGKN